MKSTASLKLLTIAFAFALVFAGVGCAAATTVVAAPAQSTSYIQSIVLTPGTLMPGETGQLTVTLINPGTTTMTISNLRITGTTDLISLESPALQYVGTIGPGNSLAVTFPIIAKDKEGTFYPTLSLDFIGVGPYSIQYPFAVVVDSKSVSLSIVERPEVFEPDTTQKVGLSIGNLRSNQIDSITVTASGEGVSCEEGTVFAGSLAPGASAQVFLTVITSEKTESINLDVSYKNGANWHTDTLTIPVEGGELKTGAELIVNNVETTTDINHNVITGDVNNAGLDTAKGLVVTLEGATSVQPYPVYVIGSLDSDGLSEFELTFVNPESDKITLVFTYKDENGNTYVQKETVSTTAVSSNAAASSGGNPVAAGIAAVILILIVGGAVFLVWKKGNLIPKREKK